MLEHFCFTVNLVAGKTAEEYESVIRDLSKETDDIFCVREVGTEFGFHFHGLIRMKKKLEAMRIYIRRRFGISVEHGPRRMSVKPWDGDPGWLRYCCKGPTETKGEMPVVIVNSLGRDVSRLHEEYYDRRAERIAENDARKKKVKAEPLRKQFVEFALAEGCETKEDVLRLLDIFLCDRARSGERLFVNEHMLVQWCNAVWLSRFPVRASSDLIARVRDRFL